MSDEYDRLLYAELAQNIRAYRKDIKMSQAELAEKVGLTRTSIVNAEGNKQQRIPLSVIYRIAHAFGCDVGEILPIGQEQ